MVLSENCENWSVLEQIALEGARKMLQQALELEVEEYIQAHTKDMESNMLRFYHNSMRSVKIFVLITLLMLKYIINKKIS